MILKIIALIILGGLIILMGLNHISFSYTIIKTGKKIDLTFIPMIILSIISFFIIQSLK